MLFADFYVRVALKLPTDSGGIRKVHCTQSVSAEKRGCVCRRMGCIMTRAITPQSDDIERVVAIFWLAIPYVGVMI
jgi:hypothetical protein